MIYIWCYEMCRALHTLNHTDASALNVAGMCDTGIGVVFREHQFPYYLIIPKGNKKVVFDPQVKLSLCTLFIRF